MKRACLVYPIALLAACATPALAQAPDSLSRASDTTSTRRADQESRFYYGGSLGLSLSNNVLWVTIQPQVGYKLTPKTSLGARLTYEYSRNRRFDPPLRSLNYGGSLFTRYRVHPRAFLHAEFEALSLDLAGGREVVPFLWLGAGYVQAIAPKTALIVEVLVDVLRDDRALSYRDQEPRINVGIGVGF